MKKLLIIFTTIVSLFLMNSNSIIFGRTKCQRINGYITCKEEKKSYVNEMWKIENRACRCPDKICAEAVFKEFMAIIADMKENEVQVTNVEGEKLGTSTKNIVQCLMFNGIAAETIQQEMAKYK